MTLDVDVRATFTAGDGSAFALDVALDVPDGETLVVLGPSGSGKTLLLESIAGVRDHAGRVALDGRDLTDAPPQSREFGFVFQDYALFPHLTVRENVAYGTRYYDDASDPDALLDSLGIAALADRSPGTLSGGEKQRVALARALAVRPDCFLLDEPLAALDAPTRASLRGLLADVLADETAVYVTHDRTTARAIGDRIAVIDDGELRQVADPETVFERPASPFVAAFTGSNCLPRRALPESVRGSLAAGTHVAIRPEHVELRELDATEEAASDVTAEVVRVVREDANYRVTTTLGDERVEILTGTAPDGDRVRLSFPKSHCHALTAANGE